MVDMPKLTEFEEEYYKWEGKYELMDPDKFYENVGVEMDTNNTLITPNKNITDIPE